MTGFARSDGRDGACDWIWEVKSVNSRGLDLRCRLPAGLDRLETKAREAMTRRFRRGAVSASLSLSRSDGLRRLGINRDLLAELIALQKNFAGEVDSAAPRLDTLLAVRGVVEPVEEEESEEDVDRRDKALLSTLDDALEGLAEMRAVEGERLEPVLLGHLDRIGEGVAAAGSCAAAGPELLRARIREQVSALLEAEPALPEERLAQEAALIAAKADVREEIDRLSAHVAAVRELVGAGGAVGRRLDFLCQELNREANTLCSKAADVELTRVGLDLKAAIEQLREQVQNIE